jgi:hypothetical protein
MSYLTLSRSHKATQRISVNILITQNNEDVPFDLRHIRYITYEYTPHGMKKFEVDLAHTIRTEMSK